MKFADDPTEYFNFDLGKAHHLSRREFEPMQLEAVGARFAHLAEKLPPLRALADQRGIGEIANLDQLPATFFHHSIYKSYPGDALIAGDFATMTAWLENFTTNDLSALDGREFFTIDAWLEAVNTDTAMHVLHSSGTTGSLSFIPRGKLEQQFSIRHAQMCMVEIAKPHAFYPNKPDYKVIWPSYAAGWSGVLTLGEMFRDAYCATPEDYHPLVPDRLSADHQLYLMQIENARAAGQEFVGAANDYIQASIDRSFALLGNEKERNAELLRCIAEDWRERKVVYAGGPVVLYNLAKAGLAQGLENVLAEGSRIITFGGFKGVSPVGDEEAVIKRFSGVPRIQFLYGMTELPTGFLMCENGRYHIPPWIIPYVLDPEAGEPAPRQDAQCGIAAFMDLTAQTYWGGLISADHVEMSWNTCSCGRTTPHMGTEIERVEG
ncbi:long-chain-fatty-acid--protein ligase [Parerythrobacter jejuensis]|uniref:Acyl-protein synthetase LuxE domain-containing protein n=1 Tax=Parerythrobacter jejuensis TaxID=795812 RepID=A0A845AMY5_9SPHN|nr:hypothetical protein [Parerythrobacter jejuensis]MXP30255.1 hypothetical protein [Parerythrobacter jejuensis]MXP33015.1 hypothetical protein [Parerythrobacter jejuensis]